MRLQYDQVQIESFVNGYVQAALWASTVIDGEEHLDSKYSGGDIEPRSFDKVKAQCLEFMEKAADLMDGGDLEQHGRDFFFTRNGHGVGFWDRDLPKRDRDGLTALSKQFGEQYWSDDGEQVYVD